MKIVGKIEQGFDGKGYVLYELRPPYGPYFYEEPVIVMTFEEVVELLLKASLEDPQ